MSNWPSGSGPWSSVRLVAVIGVDQAARPGGGEDVGAAEHALEAVMARERRPLRRNRPEAGRQVDVPAQEPRLRRRPGLRLLPAAKTVARQLGQARRLVGDHVAHCGDRPVLWARDVDVDRRLTGRARGVPLPRRPRRLPDGRDPPLHRPDDPQADDEIRQQRLLDAEAELGHAPPQWPFEGDRRRLRGEALAVVELGEGDARDLGRIARTTAAAPALAAKAWTSCSTNERGVQQAAAERGRRSTQRPCAASIAVCSQSPGDSPFTPTPRAASPRSRRASSSKSGHVWRAKPSELVRPPLPSSSSSRTTTRSAGAHSALIAVAVEVEMRVAALDRLVERFRPVVDRVDATEPLLAIEEGRSLDRDPAHAPFGELQDQVPVLVSDHDLLRVGHSVALE